MREYKLVSQSSNSFCAGTDGIRTESNVLSPITVISHLHPSCENANIITPGTKKMLKGNQFLLGFHKNYILNDNL